MTDLLVEFEEMLKKHDWYYHFTEDHRIWRQGQSKAVAISAKRKECEEAGLGDESTELFDKYCPKL